MQYKLILIYFAVISFAAMIITVSDKRKAIKGNWRIPESTLMLVGLFGGAVSMYITMKIIRHKTKHKLFMIGLPLEIILHLAIICVCVYLMH